MKKIIEESSKIHSRMRGEGTPPLLDLPGPGHKHGGAPWQTTIKSKELQGKPEVHQKAVANPIVPILEPAL